MFRISQPAFSCTTVFLKTLHNSVSHCLHMAESDSIPASSAVSVPIVTTPPVIDRSRETLRELIPQEIAATLHTSDVAGTSTLTPSNSSGECAHACWDLTLPYWLAPRFETHHLSRQNPWKQVTRAALSRHAAMPVSMAGCFHASCTPFKGNPSTNILLPPT